MPAQVCTGRVEDKLPKKRSSLDIKSLTPETHLADKYLYASVQSRYQLNEKPVPSLKLILESRCGTVIDLLAIGQVAKDLDVCKQGDVLVCLKFEVEACPKHYTRRYHRMYQVVADDTGNVGSLVWIFKSSPASDVWEHTKQRQVSAQNYIYKPLSELKENTTVDVYGVVSYFKPPYKTMGSDYCCVIYLTDESLEGPDDRLSFTIFNSDKSNFPELKTGYIIRFHRMKIREHQGKIVGQSGKGSHWLVYRGTVADRQASSASYTFKQQDRDRATNLLEWWHARSSGQIKQLCEVKEKEFFDLVCQVVRICDLVTTNHDRCKLCRVWDGTKFEGPVKVAQESDFNDTVKEDEILMEASAGLAVDLYIFDNHVESADTIKPGNFIELTNVHAVLVSGQVELTLHGGTWYKRGIRLLSPESPQVKSLQSLLDPFISKMTTNDSFIIEENNAHHIGPTCDLVFSEEESVMSDEDAHEEPPVKKCKLLSSPLNESSSQRTVKASRSSSCTKIKSADLVNQSEADSCKRKKLDITDEHGQLDRPGAEAPRTTQSQESIDLSNDSQSVWVSAYEDSDFEDQLQSTKSNHDQLQDCNISSSWTSVNSQQQADCDRNNCSDQYNSSTTMISQVNLNTSSDQRNVTDAPLQTAETLPSNKAALSVKNTDTVKEILTDSNALCTVSSSNMFSLEISTQCSDSVRFLTKNPKDSADVEDSEATMSPSFQLSAQDNLRDDLSRQACDGNTASNRDSGSPHEGSQQHQRCMLKTCSVVIGHALVANHSIKNVIEHEVPYKFKVSVRVESLMPRPTDPKELVSFVCPQCQHRELASSVTTVRDADMQSPVCLSCNMWMKPVFLLTLVLTDGEHSLSAFVWDENAIQFFGGITPLEVLKNARSFQQVQEWIENLCPVNSQLAERPLLECCLMGYRIGVSVHYQIFDTALMIQESDKRF